jgi:hypothetical protein
VTVGLGAFALACAHALRVTPGEFGLAVGLMAVSTMSAFGYPWEDPADVRDVCAQSLAVLLALEGRFLPYLAVAALFICTRESAALAGIIWLVLAPGPRALPRRLAESAAISIAGYAVAMGLRMMISKTGAVNWLPLGHNVEAVEPALAAGLPVRLCRRPAGLPAVRGDAVLRRRRQPRRRQRGLTGSINLAGARRGRMMAA